MKYSLPQKTTAIVILTLLAFTILTILVSGCTVSSLRVPTATAPITQTPPHTATQTATVIPIPTPILLGNRDITYYTFAVCGDIRQGVEVYTELLRRVESEEVAFLVNTGDLMECGREDTLKRFAEMMSTFALPFFPAAGNHDTPDGFLDQFVMYSGAPAEHYSFDYGQGHFVLADNHLGIMSADELSWLEADLTSTGQPLKMVFLHYPPFDPRGRDNVMHGGKDQFMALMEQYRVSYVFAGHIHSYAEGTRNDVQYIISGGAGAPINPDDFYHYIRVTVDGTDVSTEVVKIEPPIEN